MKDMAERFGGGAPTVRLRLLATTDLHVHLLPYDYYNDRPRPATGLAQAARVIRQLRAEAPGGASLLFDNGDFLTGGLLADLVAEERMASGAGPHPMVAAMNALGFDAGTLGNHELDRGLPYLRRALADAAFPVVSANLLDEDGRTLLPPWVILPVTVPGTDGRDHPLRVGVLGLAPPQVAGWTAMATSGAVGARDILEAAAGEIPRLRAAGADLVVALCHSGIGDESHLPGQENAAVPLAALPGLDALVVGHTHLTFPDPALRPTPAVDPSRGTIHGKPAVQPGFFGSHVGAIDLWLRQGPAAWHVAAHTARLERVATTTPQDEAVARSVAPVHDRLLALARQPLGQTRVPLQSYFLLLCPDAAMAVVADAKRAEARRLLAGRAEAALPVLCSVAPFKSGGRAGPAYYVDIPPGPLALRQAADLYIHPNTFCVVEMTGRSLHEWLERSASIFCRLVPGEEDQPLLDPSFPSYGADVIDGLAWTVDPTRPARFDAEGRLLDPAASRVLDLRYKGSPVADDDRFALATNSFRLGAAAGLRTMASARLVARSARTIQDIVIEHVRGEPIEPQFRASWRFVSLPGTAAWFDTGPGAEAHLGDISDLRLKSLGATAEGFRRFRLRL